MLVRNNESRAKRYLLKCNSCILTVFLNFEYIEVLSTMLSYFISHVSLFKWNIHMHLHEDGKLAKH